MAEAGGIGDAPGSGDAEGMGDATGIGIDRLAFALPPIAMQSASASCGVTSLERSPGSAAASIMSCLQIWALSQLGRPSPPRSPSGGVPCRLERGSSCSRGGVGDQSVTFIHE
jgi:hypothetical protein